MCGEIIWSWRVDEMRMMIFFFFFLSEEREDERTAATDETVVHPREDTVQHFLLLLSLHLSPF